MASNDPTKRLQECSFCGARPEDLERLFVGERAAICDRCIRSLAAEDAINLPRDPSFDDRLLGRWTRDMGSGASATLQFAGDGILRSSIVDGSSVTNKLLRYALKGSELSTVEMISCGERDTITVEIVDDTLKFRSKRGDSIFHREE